MSIILWLLGKNPDPSTRPRPTAGTCARKETPIPGLRLWSPATCAFDFSSHQRSPPLPHAFPSHPQRLYTSLNLLVHTRYSVLDNALNALDMDFTFGGKYRLEEEIAMGGCGSYFPSNPTSLSISFQTNLRPCLPHPHRHRLPRRTHHRRKRSRHKTRTCHRTILSPQTRIKNL